MKLKNCWSSPKIGKVIRLMSKVSNLKLTKLMKSLSITSLYMHKPKSVQSAPSGEVSSLRKLLNSQESTVHWGSGFITNSLKCFPKEKFREPTFITTGTVTIMFSSETLSWKQHHNRAPSSLGLEPWDASWSKCSLSWEWALKGTARLTALMMITLKSATWTDNSCSEGTT